MWALLSQLHFQNYSIFNNLQINARGKEDVTQRTSLCYLFFPSCISSAVKNIHQNPNPINNAITLFLEFFVNLPDKPESPTSLRP